VHDKEQYAGFESHPDCQPHAHRPQSPYWLEFGYQAPDQGLMPGLVIDPGSVYGLTHLLSLSSMPYRPDAL